jgi:tetratricopeptide (TPR) repeat protein
MPTPKMCRIAMSVIVFLALGGAASAQSTSPAAAVSTATAPTLDPNDPIAHYRAYEAAIARGDLTGASTAATLAWQIGERVWNGANPNLPGLAFNAAWAMGLANKIAEAQAPARRAVALAAQNPAAVDQKEAAFLLAYSNIMVNKNRQNLDALNVATKALDNGGWGDLLLARAYQDGAQVALEVRASRLARDLVERGLAETTRVAPGNNGLRTNFLVLRTQSSLQLREYDRAIVEVMDARRSYGVPKSERDVDWAALAAWEAASRAVRTSVQGPTYGTGSRLPKSRDASEWSKEELMALSGQPASCKGIDITRRGRSGPQGIAFPAQEQSDRYAGGAYVRARLDGTGKVINADVLSALPRPAFGVAAKRGIVNWQYDMPAGTPTECQYVDVVVMYAFMN